MQKLLSTLFKLLVSILFTLVLIEVGLRLFPRLVPLDLLIHFNDKPRTEIARQVGLKTKGETILLERDDRGPELRIFKPFTTVVWPIEDDGSFSVVVMDENGFCNPPNRTPQASKVDVITLGDSFTWCHAVDPEETWASQVSRLTGRSLYNLGMGGIGPYEYMQILKQFGIQKSPRIVIMNIYQGNDLRDVAHYYFFRLYHDDDEVVEEVTLTPPSTPTGFLAGYRFLKDLVENFSYTSNLAFATRDYLNEANPPTVVTTANDDNDDSERQKVNFKYSLVFSDRSIQFNPDNTDTDEVEYARQLYQQELRFEVLAALRQPLEEFVQLSQQNGFVPVVTYTPSAYTAYEANVVFEDPSLAEVMPWFSRQQRNFLDKQAQELGYIFIDVTPAMQAAAQTTSPERLLYYRYDLHLTVAGHTVLADTINQALGELDLLR